MGVARLTPKQRIENKRALARSYYLRNREKIIAHVTSKYVKRERARTRMSAEERSAKNKALHYAKHESRLSQKRAWAASNRHKGAAYAAARRATKRMATPSWSDPWMVEQAYEIARLRTLETGVKWEVDHIVPLISKDVCGLHVIDNLRVIPRSLNRSKGNWNWPGRSQ